MPTLMMHIIYHLVEHKNIKNKEEGENWKIEWWGLLWLQKKDKTLFFFLACGTYCTHWGKNKSPKKGASSLYLSLNVEML